MPLVIVKRNPKKIGEEALTQIVNLLPSMVSANLGVPGTEANLTEDDIEVWIDDFKYPEIHRKDVEISIWANDYPERRAKLSYAQESLTRAMKSWAPKGTSGCVWILLAPGAFGEY